MMQVDNIVSNYPTQGQSRRSARLWSAPVPWRFDTRRTGTTVAGVRTKIHKTIAWMFAPQSAPRSRWQIILWWERRRIPYNLFIGFYGICCLAVFFWGITTSGRLEDGEDAVEPIALFLAPFGVNVCYTLGWLVEIPARKLFPSLSPRFGPFLMRMGIGFSFFVISLPAVLWGGFRLLQWAHILR